MKTLYGLTVTQMYGAYYACKLENWKQFVKSIAENALHVWDNHCDIRSEIESQIAEDAIDNLLTEQNEEE